MSEKNTISSRVQSHEQGSDLSSQFKFSDNTQGARCDRRQHAIMRRGGSQVFLPRLIIRDLPFNQSSNQVQVENLRYHHLWKLALKDWFHILLRMPILISLPFLLLIWTLTILIWASIYKYVDSNNFDIDCGLGDPGIPIEFPTAFAFSLETCTTVGYGLPGSTNAFFKAECTGLQVAIFFQMTWSMLFNAFLFAFFYSQLSKSERRSLQLVFANKLCINVKDGKVFANARCYDLDSAYPLVEAHARMYLLDSKMKLHQLRLMSPNDELGGMMYPSLPQDISHHIDHHSALSPRKMPLVEHDHCMWLRTIDSATCSREEIVCPVCGESYGTYERLLKHIEYNRIMEKKEDYPMEKTHLGFEMPNTSPIQLEEVERHIVQTLSEIIVVVEGIDPQLSGTFQAVQSYKYENIEFGADFEHCIDVQNNKFTVDMKKFHGVIHDEAYHRGVMLVDDVHDSSGLLENQDVTSH